MDYYALLDVAISAEPRQIRAAYIRLAKQHHPDVGGQATDMERFNIAYRTLITPLSRKSYDLLYDFQMGTSVVHYRGDASGVEDSSLHDLSDAEIDSFIDTIYAEYKAKPKPKNTLLKKLRKIL